MSERPGYFDRVNPDLLALIPPDAKVVLEIGCGTGKLCEAYRRVNPGVKWYGVECNAEAGGKAQQPNGPLSHVYFADVEDLRDDPIRPDLQADCLILGDVLEHLQDPWDVMRYLPDFLKPGAQVLACIPNVGHWTVIRDLLAGHWRYTDEGLLDRTHLRFFTLESIREMFEQAGLQVHEIIGRDLFNEGLKDWIISNEWITEGEERDVPKEWRAYQYLVRAVKPIMEDFHDEHGINLDMVAYPEPIKSLHIHAIGDGTICERVRLHEPMAMLATIPGVRCTFGIRGFVSEAGPFDILIQQRYRGLEWSFQQWLIDQKRLIIAEIDDDPESLEGMSDQDFAPLRAVHAIQCSTEIVAETCRRWNPHVMVFENQIADLPPWEDRGPKIKGGQGTLTIGETILSIESWNEEKAPRIFFGALNRENDWAPIMPALNRVLADHPEVLMQVVSDKAFFDALETRNKFFTPFCQWPEYRKILRSCDIALLPLEPTRFNRHKSDLKFLECAAEGVACLMSEFATERLSDPHPNDAYRYYGTAERFLWLLRDAIKQRREWNSTAEIAYRYVRDNRLLSQHYRARHAWYLELLSARQALHDDLLRRCPELDPAHAPSTTA